MVTLLLQSLNLLFFFVMGHCYVMQSLVMLRQQGEQSVTGQGFAKI